MNHLKFSFLFFLFSCGLPHNQTTTVAFFDRAEPTVYCSANLDYTQPPCLCRCVHPLTLTTMPDYYCGEDFQTYQHYNKRRCVGFLTEEIEDVI